MPLYPQQCYVFDPVPSTCTLAKKCCRLYNPVMTMKQLKLAEWLHFWVINKPTYLCEERWVPSDRPCSWLGGAGSPSFGRLCLQEPVPRGHLARPVKEEPGPMALSTPFWDRDCA